MSALYFKDWCGHDHELLQKPTGEFYYHNIDMNLDIPLGFYDSDSNPITNLVDVERMPHVTRREIDGT